MAFAAALLVAQATQTWTALATLTISGDVAAPVNPLRTIAVTAPYMHDGSILTLVGGFTISSEERADLIEFLKSLTDEEMFHDS